MYCKTMHGLSAQVVKAGTTKRAYLYLHPVHAAALPLHVFTTSIYLSTTD